jgi:hypothetical protein
LRTGLLKHCTEKYRMFGNVQSWYKKKGRCCSTFSHYLTQKCPNTAIVGIRHEMEA